MSTLMRYSTVVNACSRKGFEQMPYAVESRLATSSKLLASAVVVPDAMAIWPRGIARVWITAPVAGSHSQ
ncbi:hypothetical protein D3C81_2154490 [compost metagenome]